MAYYNHESRPWTRIPAIKQNVPYTDDEACNGRSDSRYYDSSRLDNNSSRDYGWEAYPSKLDPKYGQNAHQTARRKKNTAREMKKQLVEGFAKPVECSKAERMMQLMGWQGGALGKTEGGLKEPLAPDLSLRPGAGLGHIPTHMKHKKQPKPVRPPPQPTTRVRNTPLDMDISGQQPNPQFTPGGETIEQPVLLYSYRDIPKKTSHMDNFKPEWPQRSKKKRKNSVPNKCPIRLKILEELLAFVKDNRAIGMKYSTKIPHARRKLIHYIVQCITQNDINLHSCGLLHPTLSAIFTAICECNAYVLSSQSEGVAPLRQLYVFKESREHIYLIIREDLEEEPEGEDEQNKRECNGADTSCNEDEKVIINQDNDSEIEDQSQIAEVTSKDEQNELQCNAAVASCDEDNVIRQESDWGKSFDVIINDQSRKSEDVPLIDKQNELACNAAVTSVDEDRKVISKQENGEENVLVTNSNDTIEVKRKILKGFLKEFFVSNQHTEMRFLGEFDAVEQGVLCDFVINLKECLGEIVTEENWVRDTVLLNPYTVQLDKTGAEILMKK